MIIERLETLIEAPTRPADALSATMQALEEELEKELGQPTDVTRFVEPRKPLRLGLRATDHPNQWRLRLVQGSRNDALRVIRETPGVQLVKVIRNTIELFFGATRETLELYHQPKGDSDFLRSDGIDRAIETLNLKGQLIYHLFRLNPKGSEDDKWHIVFTRGTSTQVRNLLAFLQQKHGNTRAADVA